LEHMGTRLESIRLAAPRLLRPACLAAVAESPDVLVIAGGPRTARRAAQIPYESSVPILFLPGARSPAWTGPLWGTLSLEDLIAALAREQVIPTQLSAGSANGQIFFDTASCGLLPQVPELRQAFGEAECFSEEWKVLARAANVAGRLFRPFIRFDCKNTE